jgi:hypothetical protein
MKSAYICGPLTELNFELQYAIKSFYAKIADVFDEFVNIRAFFPHEHYDPQKHAHFTPRQVDEAERDQICNKTSLLVVVALEPSWGGGIEVEMANQSGVPVVLLCERDKLQARKISRLLRGNPAIRKIIEFDDQDDAIVKLKEWINLSIVRHMCIDKGVG